MSNNVILVSPADNVAVATREIKAGEAIEGPVEGLAARADVPKNHKVAIVRIGKGSAVIKYGEPIGPLALAGMEPDEAAGYLTGRLRHLHNRLRRRIGRPPFDYEDAHESTGDAAERDDHPVRTVEARV